VPIFYLNSGRPRFDSIDVLQFQTANAEKEELKNTADKMQRQLEAAEKLINGLSSEQTRWR
jgi:hypothetical protein